jgi:hypothetical protein
MSRNVRPVTPDEPLTHLAELGAAIYGKEAALANEQYLDWKFHRNPYGTTVVICEIDNKTVGCAALIGVPMKIKNTICKGAIAGDHMAHPQYRRQGIFVDVTRESFKLGSDIAFAHGSQELDSPTVRGITKHLGFIIVGNFPVLKRYISSLSGLAHLWVYDRLTPGHLLRYLGSFAELVWITLAQTTISAIYTSGNENKSDATQRIIVRETDLQFKDEFDRLWEEVGPSFTIAVERRKEYLNWRYANPCASYRILRADVGGKLRGFIVFAYDNTKAFKTARVLDLLFASPNVGIALVEACMREAKEDGAHVLKLYKNKLTGHLSRPLGLVEAWSQNHVVAKIVKSDVPEEVVSDISNWFLTGTDIEDGI